jgi:hypothetical protein
MVDRSARLRWTLRIQKHYTLGTGYGLFKTTDGGANWTLLNRPVRRKVMVRSGGVPGFCRVAALSHGH